MIEKNKSGFKNKSEAGLEKQDLLLPIIDER